MENLIKKYDRPGPRYTSYPPVPFWSKPPTEEEWVKVVNTTLASEPLLDIYIHIPFCEKLCYYCGCHRVITKDKSRGKKYVEDLIFEWSHYLRNIQTHFQIGSIHFGGGTPTFLSPEDLNHLLKTFEPFLSSVFTGSVEVDPRTCSTAQFKVLRHHGFDRISMGIQDFDPVVQTKINRHQSFKMVKELSETARGLGFTSVNFDLIYGLPGQDRNSLTSTLSLVKELGPDTVAFYSYAHLPQKILNQRLIREEDLPSPQEKLGLYLLGKELLEEDGYVNVGMDHYAKENSFLRDKVTRNFMGYTDKKSPLLIGLGASAISEAPGMYTQNAKDLNSYEGLLLKGLPLVHGHELTHSEKEVGAYIQDLFCSGEVSFQKEFLPWLQSNADLQDLKRDGLIEWDGRRLILTKLGRGFVRNVAFEIDPLMKRKEVNWFSRTI